MTNDDYVCTTGMHGEIKASAGGLQTWYPAKRVCVECIRPLAEKVLAAWAQDTKRSYSTTREEHDAKMLLEALK